MSLAESPAHYATESAAPVDQTLAEARGAIAARTEAHATSGQGFLVLAHPSGIGKGHNTTIGLKHWLGAVPPGDDGSGFLVWMGPRKEQITDQQGIDLIPLAGRSPDTCRLIGLPNGATLANYQALLIRPRVRRRQQERQRQGRRRHWR